MSGGCKSKGEKAILTFFAVVFLLANISAGKYGGGDGSAAYPYLITTPADLNDIGNHPEDWDKHFELTADIDLSGYDGLSGPEFKLIGGEFVWSGSSYVGDGFSGVFDGGGHTIWNFTYLSAGTNCVGIFRGIEGGRVTDIELANPNVLGGEMTGALAGLLTNSAGVVKCRVVGGEVRGSNRVGGLAGYTEDGVEITDSHSSAAVYGSDEVGGFLGLNNYDGYIARCYAAGYVSGSETVGGFVGLSRESAIEQCYATGDVYASYMRAGGFAGCIADYATITDCYARGSVTGVDYVGNFLGRNTSYTSDLIRCYATGYISSPGVWVHGMAGRYYPECYGVGYNFFDTQTSGTGNACGGVGKVTALMYQQSTYVAEGWDFATPMWTIEEGLDYPKLWWQSYYYNDSYGGGTGRPKDPFVIYDANQMNAVGANPDDWDKHFRLMADIDLGGYTGTQFNVIGNAGHPFGGIFDGAGHTISDFTRSVAVEDNVGLFGYVDGTGAEINELALGDADVNVGSGFVAGTLIGELDRGTVTLCRVGGRIEGDWIVGGLVGRNGSAVWRGMFPRAARSSDASVPEMCRGPVRTSGLWLVKTTVWYETAMLMVMLQAAARWADL